MVLALAPVMTWLFNHTGESVLLAILAHASVNTVQQMVAQLFAGTASTLVNLLLAFGVVALVLVVATRGRLGYRAGELALPHGRAPEVEPVRSRDRP